MTDDRDSSRTIDGILADYLQRVEAGEQVDRALLLQQFPELAGELQAFFSNDDRLRQLATPPNDPSRVASRMPVDLPTLDSTPGHQPSSAEMPTFDSAVSARSPAASLSGGNHKVRYFGDYELLDEIARGGMGVVYKARQVNLKRVVALKMILAGQLASEQDVKRFYQEAEAAANLNHPGIVPIYEIGQHGGQHFFSMAFVEGDSLSKRVADGPLPPREAADLLRKVAVAVEYAHQRGVVHRDLKPANVLLDAQGEPIVTDFGLAKNTEGDRELTTSGQILGTPGYMPPEQAAGAAEKIGPPADIYSLGAILYCLLTGRPPFLAANVLDTLMQVLEKEPLPPRDVNPSVPRDLETICLKCLQKDRHKRYASAQALADDLGRWLHGEPILARPVGRVERGVKWVRRHPAVAGLVAAVVLALIGGTVVSSVFAVRASRAADAERIASKDADEKRRLAEANEQRAIKEEQRAQRNEVAEKRARQVAQQNLYLADMRLAQEAWQSGHLQRLRELLDRHVPREGETDLRGWEWRLMDAAWKRYSLVLDGERWCAAVAWSPDDRFLATGHVDPHRGGPIRIWDVASGLLIHTLNTKSMGAFGVAWSPDGTRLATACADGSVVLWQVSDGTELRRWKAHTGETKIGGWFPCWSVAWHPAGDQLATSGRDGLVKVWDAESGELRQELSGHGKDVYRVAWSPDGRRLASSGIDRTVRVWDPEEGKAVFSTGITVRGQGGVIVSPLGHEGRVWSIAWSPDGKKLASGSDDRTVRIWDAETGRPLRTIRQKRDTRGFWAWKGSTEAPLVGLGHDSFIHTVAWSPDGARIVSGSEDQTVRVWDAESGRELETLRPHRASVEALAFSYDGRRLASAGKDGSIAVIDRDRPPEAIILNEPVGEIKRLCWSSDGRRILTGHDDQWGEPHFHATLWDVSQRALVKRFEPLTSYPHALAWIPNTQRAVWSVDWTRVAMVNLENGDSLADLEIPAGIASAACDPSGARLALGCGDGFVCIYDSARRTVLRKFQPHAKGVGAVAWSSDGRWLAAGSADNHVTISNSETGEIRHRLRGHRDEVTSVAWSPDGRWLASGSNDRTIRIWDVESGQSVRTIQGHVEMVSSVAWHPHGNRVASAAFDGTIKLWDVGTWREILSLRAHVQGIPNQCLAWSPDGSQLASGSRDRSVVVWNAASALASPDSEKLRLAKRLLALGGTLDLGASQVNNVAALPETGFAIRGVAFASESVLTASDLEGVEMLDALETLDLHDVVLNDAVLEALANSKQLRRIDLTNAPVSQQAVAKLKAALPQCTIVWEDFAADRAAAEKFLSLGGSVTVLNAGAKEVITQPGDLPQVPFRVAAIHLSQTAPATDDDLTHLEGLTALEELMLWGTGITDDGLPHLAELTNLRTLRLNGTSVSGTGFRHLGKLQQLRQLSAGWGTFLTDEGLSQLPPLQNLLLIALNPRKLSEESLQHFAKHQSLEVIQLIWGNLNGSGLRHLAALPKLRTLLLDHLRLTDDNLASLADLKALRILRLDSNPDLTDAALEHLAPLQDLEKLDLRETAVTAEGVKALQAKLPDCEIKWDGK
jgi:WD40 repeat protein/tRNA A-37 threonylcarbamoyl transferase component Bud32